MMVVAQLWLIQAQLSRHAPKWFAADNPLQKSEHLELRTVAGDTILHHGRRHVHGRVRTNRVFQPTEMQFECCDVAGPVASVAKLNDRGCSVCFPSSGTEFAEKDGLRVPIARENDIFVMDFLMDEPGWQTVTRRKIRPSRHTTYNRPLQIAPLVRDEGAAAADPDRVFDDMLVPFDQNEEENLALVEDQIENEQFDPALGPEAGEAIELAGRLPPKAPKAPSEHERILHEAQGHCEYEPWCEFCISARGRETPHRRQQPRVSEIPVICADYCYMTAGGKTAPEECEGGITILNVIDTASGAVLSTCCPVQGVKDAYNIAFVAKWCESLGYKRVIMRTDGESSLMNFMKAVAKASSTEIVPETTTVDSHGGVGAVEQVHECIRGSVVSMEMHMEKRLGKAFFRGV
jgi:hypothetical protein